MILRITLQQVSSMSFLDKFKGKTHFLTKGEASQILGNIPRHQRASPTHINSSFTAPNINIKPKIMPKNNKHNKQRTVSKQFESPKLSPFYVSNPFYLDESERQRYQKAKKQKEIHERLERERRKRKQLEAKLASVSQSTKEQYRNKEWVKLGGLGPNIGGEQWKKKSEMHSKMMKFAQEIKEINFSRLKCVSPMSYSNLSKDSRMDARTKALQYSRSIPKPALMSGSKIIQTIPRSESIEQLEQLEELERNHQKYVTLMKQM